MSKTKIKRDYEALLKMGFDCDMARIVSLSNNGCVDEALEFAEDTIIDEQKLIISELKNCGFVPFEENIKANSIEDDKNKDEKPDIQYIKSEQ
jgi:Ran GTPase-activating protein (RanGAP) involved in mRNA processing and transport